MFTSNFGRCRNAKRNVRFLPTGDAAFVPEFYRRFPVFFAPLHTYVRVLTVFFTQQLSPTLLLLICLLASPAAIVTLVGCRTCDCGENVTKQRTLALWPHVQAKHQVDAKKTRYLWNQSTPVAPRPFLVASTNLQSINVACYSYLMIRCFYIGCAHAEPSRRAPTR